MCNCVYTRHIVISASIDINYALFVMHLNSISVYFATNVYIGIGVYFGVDMVKTKSMSMLRRIRTIGLQDAVEIMLKSCRQLCVFFL